MAVGVVAPQQPSAAPPGRRKNAPEWARRHLFSSWYNTLLTLVFGALFAFGAVWVVRWVFFEADWEIIRVNLTLFIVGRFPRDQLWRTWLASGIIAVLLGAVGGSAAGSARARAAEAGLPYAEPTWREWVRRFWPVILLVVVLLAFASTATPALLTLACAASGIVAYLVAPRFPAGLRRWTWLMALGLLAAAYLALAGFGGVGWEEWSGLQLNLFLTVSGILFAFPFGVLLAIGRRSSLPVVRAVSVGYIEFIRGVPLITLLFMGAFALGFLLPATLRPGQVTRALIAITAFEAAYIAEVVRGGLQAVPRGQVEAAEALGLPAWKTMRLVVMPQALRAVIPAMVGQFISLFKDTSLVAIIGLTDVLRVSTVSTTQPEFLGRGLDSVTLAFVGLIFWVGCYTMSREARRLERRVGIGER